MSADMDALSSLLPNTSWLSRWTQHTDHHRNSHLRVGTKARGSVKQQDKTSNVNLQCCLYVHIPSSASMCIFRLNLLLKSPDILSPLSKLLPPHSEAEPLQKRRPQLVGASHLHTEDEMPRLYQIDRRTVYKTQALGVSPSSFVGAPKAPQKTRFRSFML